MKTKNIFRMLLVAAALLMGANNVKADELLFDETVVGGICYPSYGGDARQIKIETDAFTDIVNEDHKIKIEASLNQNDGSEGRFSLQIVNSSYMSFEFKDWNGDNGGTFIKDTDNSTNFHSTYFEFTLSPTSVNRLTNVNNVGGGLIINILGLTITKVWLITESSDSGNDDTGDDNGDDNGNGDDTGDDTGTDLGTEPAYITSCGYATFSCSSALNFANVFGMKAYVATNVNNQQNTVTLTQVIGTVAANTGLILISDNKSRGSFNIPKAQNGSEYNNNLLVPGNGSPLELSNNNSYIDYVLIVDTDDKPKFAEVWDSHYLPTIEVGKAYLHVPTTNGARIRNLSIIINNGTTGINSVESESYEKGIFNLRGQRVENPTKGLYIINGKKVVIK